MDKATPQGRHSKRATRGVVLQHSVYGGGLRRGVSKAQEIYKAYGGTGVLGLDARVARDKAARLRPLDTFRVPRLKEWHDDVYQEWAKDVWRELVMPPLPEIAERIGRWRRTWARIKERELRSHKRVTSGLVGRGARMVGPLGPRGGR